MPCPIFVYSKIFIWREDYFFFNIKFHNGFGQCPALNKCHRKHRHLKVLRSIFSLNRMFFVEKEGNKNITWSTNNNRTILLLSLTFKDKKLEIFIPYAFNMQRLIGLYSYTKTDWPILLWHIQEYTGYYTPVHFLIAAALSFEVRHVLREMSVTLSLHMCYLDCARLRVRAVFHKTVRVCYVYCNF